jgi:hypothetical protein
MARNSQRKIFYFLLCIFSLLSILFYTCKKSGSEPELPPVTQTGANTFGCRVNGNIWVPYWPIDQWTPGAAVLIHRIISLDSGSVAPLFITILAGNVTDGQSFFHIGQAGKDHIYGPGNIYDSLLIQYFLGSPGGEYFNLFYPTGDTGTHYFQITKFDTVKRIISGVFAFTLYSDANDSVVVTEGRFDFMMGE